MATNKHVNPKCDCVVSTPKGFKYHPALVRLYVYSNKLEQVGWYCNKCYTVYKLKDKVKIQGE